MKALGKESQLFNVRFSSRELEVLRFLVEGYSNKQIAIALQLSPNTIKTHIRSLMNKLGVNHRLQIVVLALRHNLV
jgi:DNA-binding NarL/FixJ family response regulator